MNAVCQPLLARTRFALQQNIVVRARHAPRPVLQRQKFLRFAHHAVQAVAAAVAHRMRNRRLQVLNRHRQHARAAHLAASLQRHHRRNVLIRAVRRNPRNLAVVRRHPRQGLANGNMVIIQEYVGELRMPVQALFPAPVRKLELPLLVQPVKADRQFLHHQLDHAPVLQQSQVLLHAVLHRH